MDCITFWIDFGIWIQTQHVSGYSRKPDPDPSTGSGNVRFRIRNSGSLPEKRAQYLTKENSQKKKKIHYNCFVIHKLKQGKDRQI